MGVVNNISTITSWQNYLNKVSELKYPTIASPTITILTIKTSTGSSVSANLSNVINGTVSFSGGAPLSVKIERPDVYSLKNITATINGLNIDFNFEINYNVELLKLFPEGLNFSINPGRSARTKSLSSNGLPEYAFEKDENGNFISFSGNYYKELGISKSFKVYKNTLEGNILAPEDAYPITNDDKFISYSTNIILSEKNDATYFNTSLIPSEELPEELTERISKVISGEITFSAPENMPFIEIKGIFSTVTINSKIKSAFYFPLNADVIIVAAGEYVLKTHSKGLSVEDYVDNNLRVRNISMTKNGFIKFLNEPEPEPEDEWWSMMIALGRA